MAAGTGGELADGDGEYTTLAEHRDPDAAVTVRLGDAFAGIGLGVTVTITPRASNGGDGVGWTIGA